MTTKTKKAPKEQSETAVDAGMVGAFVVRTVGGTYLRPSLRGWDVALSEAMEFESDFAAADAAQDYHKNFPDGAATLQVCKVMDAAGRLSVISYVYVTADAPGETFEGPADPAAEHALPEWRTREQIVQGELLPSDAGVAAPAPVTGTLVLSSPGGALMAATALKAHAADLKKLAKGARELSQHKEALTFEQNATMIEETLLVQLEPQAKLPFGYADVKKALGDRISGKLRSQLVTAIKRDTPLMEGDKDGKERTAKIEQRIDDFEELVGNVASIVTALVEPVVSVAAEKGMLAGRLARETACDTLALEAIEAVNHA
jgi:hypothetical protein